MFLLVIAQNVGATNMNLMFGVVKQLIVSHLILLVRSVNTLSVVLVKRWYLDLSLHCIHCKMIC